ncbi:hypothetical protein UP10_13220 [Bradyrhizobium sp. LTSPM299]|uniref:hypothetical protein n=1 Tax=Bradyrhizobium sp. LTSPM299 TaxID=1619233 RepID=UPI0005CA9502|nr:hypothetical protein [Bradyrhizobium sp. LTSPM299]KJC60310.1 hypothetical protein UP10_13220 [Bradyrhizobium sp. LTSPM299]
MLKRIDRAKVDNIIAELLKRVAEINADSKLCYFVNEIRLFGCAIVSDAESFGDVDIAYDIGHRRRPPEYKKWHDWARERWKLAGRSNLNFMQQLCYAEHEVLRLLKGRNQYLSIHNFNDLVGIGADNIRLFILPEGQIQAEDSVSGEELHRVRMASAKERAEKKEQTTAKGAASTIKAEHSPEQIKRRMITAVRSLAFDLLRAIDEPSPPEALEQSIIVAHQRIKDYREMNLPDRIPNVLCDVLSNDVIEQNSRPDTFVFSEDRERMAQDGTDKADAAHTQITHAVLKKLKSRVLGHPNYRWDDIYVEIEQAFRLRREADFEEYEYRRTHPRTEFYGADFLSDTAVSTLRSIGKGNTERLHKQALGILSKYDFIRPFRKKWRLTPKGERAIKYHAEKDAFHAKRKGNGTGGTAEP